LADMVRGLSRGPTDALPGRPDHAQPPGLLPNAPWPEYYAERVLECLGPAEEPKTDRLALYHFDGCPFCIRVRGVIGELGLDVEMRNIYEDKTRREELREARGRTTVPVLRITSGDGQVRWMPESADIIRYLQVTYGRAAA